MRKAIYLIIIWAVSVLSGCTSDADTKVVTREGDMFIFQQAAMSIYAYQPPSKTPKRPSASPA